jgi:glycosyltransferase involved in cell wall biosynthesis
MQADFIYYNIQNLFTGGMTMESISLCMIVKDEEKNIARCLASVAGAVEEIIVVDTGSADETCRIAREFGARVRAFAWNGNFSDARNAGLELAGGDWVLFLDADEELQQECIGALRQRVMNEAAEGYFMRIINYVGNEKEMETCPDLVFRLFRNRPEYRFHGAIHEQIADVIEAKNSLGKCIIAEELAIFHYGYLDDQLAGKDKKERNISLIRREMAQRPEDRMLRYHYGVELFRAGQYRQAAEEFTAVANGIDPRVIFLPKLLRYLVLSYQHAQMYEESLAMVDFAAKLLPDYADLYYYAGLICYERQEYGRSLGFFEQAMNTPEQPATYASFAGTRGFRARYYLGRIAEAFGNQEEALRHYIFSLRDNSSFIIALEAIVRILKPREEPADARAALEKLFDFSVPSAYLRLVEILYRQAAYDLVLDYIEKADDQMRQIPQVRLWQAACLMHKERFMEALVLLDTFAVGDSLYFKAQWDRLLCYWLQNDPAKVRSSAATLSAQHHSKDAGLVIGLIKYSCGPRKKTGIFLEEEGRSMLMEAVGRGLDLRERDKVQALLSGLSKQCIKEMAASLAEVFKRYEQPDLAQRYLAIAIRQNPHNAANYAFLAEIKESLEQSCEAEALYRQAIALDPKYPYYYIQLIRLYDSMRREALKQIRENYPDAAGLPEMAEEGDISS